MTLALAGNALLCVSTGLILACIVAYSFTTRGGWRDSEVGRHLMAFMASEGSILVLGVVRLITESLGWPDPDWFRGLRVLVFVTLPVVIAWRLRIILKAARGELRGP
jgi:hypothetical protein